MRLANPKANMEEKKIMILCGEPSGEMYAAMLTEELKKINNKIKIFAIGSQLLRSKEAEVFYDINQLAAIGLFDVIKKIPRFLTLKKIVLDKIKTEKPQLVILIDFSGFNLRIAQAINNSLPVVYYISPQVWASRPGRIKTIKRYVKKMLVLFQFEEKLYKKYGVNAQWVGHPLLDIVKPSLTKEQLLEKLNLSKNKITISLFPGSREEEIRRILPIMLKSAEIIAQRLAIQLIIAKTPMVSWAIYQKFLKDFSLENRIVEGKPYDCINTAQLCLICSGTATLETALLQKPFVIIYKTSLLNYLFYRPLVKVPFIGLVNIIKQKKIIPEFIQFQAKPKNIARAALNILQDPEENSRIQTELNGILPLLGKPQASLRAAKIIYESFIK